MCTVQQQHNRLSRRELTDDLIRPVFFIRIHITGDFVDPDRIRVKDVNPNPDPGGQTNKNKIGTMLVPVPVTLKRKLSRESKSKKLRSVAFS